MEVLFFAAKVFVVVLGLGALILLIAFLAARANQEPELEVELLHKKYQNYGHYLQSFTLRKRDRKAFKKQLKAQAESEEKKEASSEPGRLFFVRFEGSKDADEVESLREEITAILQLAKPQDEVLVSLESPGGTVQGYGLGAAQLLRIRERQIRLSVAVDRVAASGGYLMACVAHQIVASPFAILGSIGVVAGLPNFHRLLAKNSIDYKEYTAGEFKRTVSLLGEITEKGEEKFKQQLESIHIQFKNFVSSHRPQLNLAAVATGEHWLASEALGMGLVDRLVTSDDFLLEKFSKGWPIYQVKYTRKQKLVQRLTSQFTQSMVQSLGLWLEKFESRIFS